jgi:hypothetical protein
MACAQTAYQKHDHLWSAYNKDQENREHMRATSHTTLTEFWTKETGFGCRTKFPT